jgi:hypothetical protein
MAGEGSHPKHRESPSCGPGASFTSWYRGVLALKVPWRI